MDISIDAESRRLGAQRERERLRPLLERAVRVISGQSELWRERDEVLAALRAELGKVEVSDDEPEDWPEGKV